MKTMQKVQRGFTLIELMIVVAIIGILAALAIPAYTDYTIRSKVGESASLTGSAKTAVDIWYSENGTLATVPVTHASLGLSNAGSYNAQYVSSVQVGNNGVITVTMNSADDDGTALPSTVGGLLVVFEPTPRGGNLQWNVSVGGSTVATKYLPRD